MGKKRIGLNVRNTAVLLDHLPHYYEDSVTVLQEFGGPSVHFHLRALEELAKQNGFLSDSHLEMIYATLASWGMHRMGDPEDTKAKMVEFEAFRSSLLQCRDRLSDLRQYRIEIPAGQYAELLSGLAPIYSGLVVSIADSTLVAHAKTLAHILPDLLPPIDRQYTVRFFEHDASEFFVQNKRTGKWNYRGLQLSEAAEHFEQYVSLCCKIKALFDQAQDRYPDLMQVTGQGFNTSYPKIIDNLIMAFVKTVKPPQNTP